MSELVPPIGDLRGRIGAFIGLPAPVAPSPIVIHEEVRDHGYTRKLISYASDGDVVQAFLLEPLEAAHAGAVVALHQHNSQWHLGKSEIAGLAGDPFQAFGPALARMGITVLAPDAIGFESRRGPGGDASANPLGPLLDPARGASQADWLQYYNHAMHRLVAGDLLVRTVLADTATAVSVLRGATGRSEVGVIGHSYGGIVALFAAALDTRIHFAVTSGAACSYRHKLAHGIGLDMSLVIPGFAARFDLDDLIRCVPPRKLLVVSSEDDPLSADAESLVSRAIANFPDGVSSLEHLRTPGGHALDERRFTEIVAWVVSQTRG